MSNENLTTLIPVKLCHIIRDNAQILTLIAQNGDIIMQNQPKQWSLYIRDAINNFYKRDKNIKIVTSNTIFAFKIPKKPLVRGEGKGIVKNDDGTYSITPDKEYRVRLLYLNRAMKNTIKALARQIPITYPVIVECQFYIKRNVKKKPANLSGLVCSTIEILHRFGIIQSTDSSIVASVDGSRVHYIDTNDEHTIVSIKKLGD